MPVAPRSNSKDRKKEVPTGTQNNNTNTGSSGTQNLVSAEDVDPVEKREIYSDSSNEDLSGGAYGGYAAELTEGQMQVDFEEYLSDESTDSESSYDYWNTVSPPTPPRP